MEKELNMERETLKEQEKIMNLWEICDRLAQGSISFLTRIPLLLNDRSFLNKGLNDRIKETIKQSNDKQLNQALEIVSGTKNRFRYCTHFFAY